ncbi:hypothetical protein KBI52_31290 [Microvirga sp. HBU67558]|uniref:hypothetical protein n=1 Tax=Microvirga TaxID=186650 RepID=UPI001B359F01|nr:MULTISPECIES: hypothetical protein [unclassified Microvirga]MBQ0824691.1 hypothetical protein [Microvirga sp. HBU67558]
MSQLHLSDEILMAFADGELEEPTAAAIAKAMAEDPAVARRIMEFQQSRRLTRSALSDALSPDVPAHLRSAVSAQIKAYEAAAGATSGPRVKVSWGERLRSNQALGQWAMAASVAAVALALGYFAGWWNRPEAHGLLARLDSPILHRELDRTGSGQDVDLPFGRLRVISTYRLADGSLCREFRLHAPAEAAEAVACRDGEWKATFALATPVGQDAYVPSGGGDPTAAYLQTIGAGEPLAEEAEAKALAETSP